VNAAQLYCQGACAACSALARSLTDAGVALVVHDVAADPSAYDAVIELGYRSLPVLVAPDGTSAAGPAAGALARRLGPATPLAFDRHVHNLEGHDGDAEVPSGAPPPALHPDVAALAPFLGEWTGPDRGTAATRASRSSTTSRRCDFGHAGKPFLTYAQRTVDTRDGRALHVETGYLRPAGAGRVELVVAQPTLRLDGGVLRTTLAMAAVDHPLTHHLASELRQPAPKSTTEEVQR